MTASGKSHKLPKTSLVTSKYQNCLVCKKNGHNIYKCRVFSNLSSNERVNKVRALNLCFNCLRGHGKADRKSNYTYQVCKGKHHTLLHCQAKANATLIE